MNVKQLLLLASTAMMLTTACDDDTATLGVNMMPVADLTQPSIQTYEVKTSSYAVGDAVLARTNRSYLGRFTDPETGTTVKSDFLAQFHCDESFGLPDQIENDACTSAEVNLYVEKYVGDSLATFKLSVYELDEQLDADQNYYTNINPADYYDETATQPLATKWFTLSDRTITDEARSASGYVNNIRIALDPSIGTKIIQDYRQHPEHFAGTSAWLNSGNPCSRGLYFKLERGDGAMAYIYVAQLNLHFRYYDTGYAKDTTGLCSFAATEEVVEATRFENTNLDRLMANTDTTYLKSPAGIFTLAELPADQISLSDTINSAKLTFTRYNDRATGNGQNTFKLDIPKTILLVRLDDYLNGFFENYQVSNDITSYLTTFNSSNNTYTFNNVARLLTRMAQEKANGTATENWNKVLLIPVEATYDSSNNLVKLNHDFSMGSAKLVGGDNDRVPMEVIYTTFK